MENLTTNTTSNINLENMTDEQLKAVIEKALEISNKRKNSTTTDNELDKLYWSMNTLADNEISNVIDKCFNRDDVSSYYRKIDSLLMTNIKSEEVYNSLKNNIENEIENIICTFTQELFKYSFSKAVKLMTDCYNYKI